ncbi:NgoFVII family restriction endonuclease [Natronorubrum sp. JWXQ-INN-674]|uniref:NgoFVII family restriction endonuclease n=1 Tax=Natronorubrum halalkaliphilum TaxID=2691917 RepID=A0A6B0VUS4_9EURY|nr:phospholipase D family protein [Natronorubrum halalkaliphilum]MXV64482.1 NgoFVII family restriction endonuclease [Natronorubrum halalkaliphilum]
MNTSPIPEFEVDPAVGLLGTNDADRRVQDALADLFAGDGTIYLVSGYFTYQGYLAIRDDIVSFLERSRDNVLISVVGPASDQFSARIARDLWALDDREQVRLYKRPRGLHAKLYIRDGPNPRCIVGSANITQVAFEYNVELGLEMTRESRDHPDLRPFFDWAEGIVATAEPLGRRDLLGPVQIASSVVNWSNKARLLPSRNVALRVVPALLLLVGLAGLFRLV